MKKIAFMMVCLMAMLFVSNNTYAQDKKNPFIGSWLATASTPMGDSEMTIVFEENDGKITGYMRLWAKRRLNAKTSIQRKQTKFLSLSIQLWQV